MNGAYWGRILNGAVRTRFIEEWEINEGCYNPQIKK